MNNNNQNRNNNRFDNNKDKNKGYDIDKGLDCIYPLLDRQNSVTSISDAVSEIEKLMIYACSDRDFNTHQMRNIYSIIKQNSGTLTDLAINRPR